MNTNSLRLIEDITINSGVLSFLEIAQDTIYLDFINVELGNPKTEEEITLSIRFGDNSFIAFSTMTYGIWNSCQTSTTGIRK